MLKVGTAGFQLNSIMDRAVMVLISFAVLQQSFTVKEEQVGGGCEGENS